MTVDEICQVKIEFSNGNVDVIGIHTEPGLRAIRVLLQPLSIGALEGDRFEENNHD